MLHAGLALARAAVSEAVHSSSGLRPLHPPADWRRRSLSDAARPGGVVAGTPPSGEWAGGAGGGGAAGAPSSSAAVRRQSLDVARRGSLDLGTAPAPPRRRASVDGPSGSGRVPLSFDVPAFLPNVSCFYGFLFACGGVEKGVS